MFFGGLTYNSHPVSLAAALANIGVYEEDDLIGNAAGNVAALRSCLNRQHGDRRLIVSRRENVRLRRLRIHQHGLSPQRLRRLFPVATTILDGKPAEMRKSATQRDVQYARLGRPAEKLAARRPCLPGHALEHRVAPRLGQRPAELRLEEERIVAEYGDKIIPRFR